jgi:hypothetical protein
MPTISRFLAACALACFAASAQAISFTANDGSATADITAAPNGPNTNVTIILSNITAPTSTTSAGNLLTGLDFTGVGTMSLSSQTASQEFNFSSQKVGSVDNGGPFDPTWAIVSGKGLYFNGFGTGGKPIIGPAASDTTYANANPSLTSGPHGAYEYKTATFVLLAPGAFDPASLTGVNFLFNTDGNTIIPGPPDSGGGVPEPASLSLLGLGALALLARRRK